MSIPGQTEKNSVWQMSSELPLKADMPELVRESEGLRRWGFFAEDENGKRARKRHVESSAGGGAPCGKPRFNPMKPTIWQALSAHI
jgi:hypothetical protein